MNRSRPDVVFDCNVFLQALARAKGPAAEALRLVEQNHLTLHLSRAILRELGRVLAYPEVQQKNPAVTDEGIDAFLSRISFRGVLHRIVPHIYDFPRDHDDEPYIDLAGAVNADYLITRDKDLLSLAMDHTVEAKQFRQRFPRLSVLNPVDFLGELRRSMPDAFAAPQ
jgi:putative PIN family toxin of toxin-antitoxin system